MIGLLADPLGRPGVSGWVVAGLFGPAVVGWFVYCVFSLRRAQRELAEHVTAAQALSLRRAWLIDNTLALWLLMMWGLAAVEGVSVLAGIPPLGLGVHAAAVVGGALLSLLSMAMYGASVLPPPRP